MTADERTETVTFRCTTRDRERILRTAEFYRDGDVEEFIRWSVLDRCRAIRQALEDGEVVEV